MSVKLRVSFDTEDEIKAVLARLRPLLRRVRRPEKTPESGHYKAYIDLKMPPKEAEKPKTDNG